MRGGEAVLHGTVFRSPRRPDYWKYNCIRLDRPMEAGEMIAAADRELFGCAHRYAERMIPMPNGVVSELGEHGWMANPLIFLLHDRRALPEGRGNFVEVDYDAVRELRDLWHREDFGEHTETENFHTQAREVPELANVRVIAAVEGARPIGFAQVETHDGGSEISNVFVRPERRGAGLRSALTARTIRVGADAAPNVGSAPSAITAHASSTSGSAFAWSSRPAWRSSRPSRNPATSVASPQRQTPHRGD